jgi:hypothetical protein
MCRLDVIRFGSMDTRGGSKETRPTRRPRHLRTTGIRTWPSNESFISLINIVNRVVVHSLSACVKLSGISVFFIGIS